MSSIAITFIRLLLVEEEKELAVRPILAGTFQLVDAVHRRRLCHRSRQRLLQWALPTSVAKSWYPHSCRPLQPTRLATGSFEPEASLVEILQAIERFFQGYKWVFEVFFPQLQTCLCSSQNVFFASWVIEFLLPVLGCLDGPNGFRFLTLTWFFGSCCLAHISAVTIQLFPLTSIPLYYRISVSVSPLFISTSSHFYLYLYLSPLSSQCNVCCVCNVFLVCCCVVFGVVVLWCCGVVCVVCVVCVVVVVAVDVDLPVCACAFRSFLH